jgi:hypothetical protein
MVSFRTPACISFEGLFTPFSNRLYVSPFVVIGVVKKTSKNNGIISCRLGLSLVGTVMTVLNLRTATAEQFLTGFYSNFIND